MSHCNLKCVSCDGICSSEASVALIACYFEGARFSQSHLVIRVWSQRCGELSSFFRTETVSETTASVTTCALTFALTDVFESVSLVAPGRSAGDLFAASPSGLECPRGAVSPSHKSSDSESAAAARGPAVRCCPCIRWRFHTCVAVIAASQLVPVRTSL